MPRRSYAISLWSLLVTTVVTTPTAAQQYRAVAKSDERPSCSEQYECAAGSSANAAPDQRAAMSLTQTQCPQIEVFVAGASADELRLACSAAAEGLRLLAHCEISPHRPLFVEVGGLVRNPLGKPIFGTYDINRARVRVTSLANIQSLTESTPYHRLPLKEFYRSIILHETVHKIMHDNYKRQPASHASYEYPAYALQLEALPSAVRDMFLNDTYGSYSDSEGRDFIFSDSLLFFDPFFFAARSYLHSVASADRCANLRAILSGEASFIVSTSGR